MIRRLIAALSIMLLFVTTSPLTAAAYNPFGSVCNQGGTGSSAVCTDSKTKTNPISGPNGLIMDAVNLIALIAGIAAVILLIIAGIKYVTSNGDSNSINNARDTVLNTLIGIVVIVLARSIIAFIINRI